MGKKERSKWTNKFRELGKKKVQGQNKYYNNLSKK